MQELFKALFILLYKKGLLNDAELSHIINSIDEGKPVEELIVAINHVSGRRT